MFFRTIPYTGNLLGIQVSDLSRKRERERLKIRREPYWQRLAKGSYLGFRRGPNTWIARHRNRDGKQEYNALPDSSNYDEAKQRAEAWCRQMGSTAVRSAQRGTVSDALATYVEYLRRQGREATADNAESRFKLIIQDDRIADIKLEELTTKDMEDWRDRLRHGRQSRSVNRHVRSVTAGLNVAHTKGHIGDPRAWKLEPLADDKEEGGETAVFLTPSQRRAIIANASPAGGKFLRGLELTGARPNELAAATTSDMDADHGTLTLRHKKGRPAKLRARTVVLDVDGIAFFKILARGKLPAAPLFLDSENRPWHRYEWANEVNAALRKYNTTARGNKRIPNEASAYSFRHARISELLQVHGIDPVTVAHQTGTSTRMIEQAYFKFIATALREKLSAVSESSR